MLYNTYMTSRGTLTLLLIVETAGVASVTESDIIQVEAVNQT